MKGEPWIANLPDRTNEARAWHKDVAVRQQASKHLDAPSHAHGTVIGNDHFRGSPIGEREPPEQPAGAHHEQDACERQEQRSDRPAGSGRHLTDNWLRCSSVFRPANLDIFHPAGAVLEQRRAPVYP
jgi:hypothetical protein